MSLVFLVIKKICLIAIFISGFCISGYAQSIESLKQRLLDNIILYSTQEKAVYNHLIDSRPQLEYENILVPSKNYLGMMSEETLRTYRDMIENLSLKAVAVSDSYENLSQLSYFDAERVIFDNQIIVSEVNQIVEKDYTSFEERMIKYIYNNIPFNKAKNFTFSLRRYLSDKERYIQYMSYEYSSDDYSVYQTHRVNDITEQLRGSANILSDLIGELSTVYHVNDSMIAQITEGESFSPTRMRNIMQGNYDDLNQIADIKRQSLVESESISSKESSEEYTDNLGLRGDSGKVKRILQLYRLSKQFHRVRSEIFQFLIENGPLSTFDRTHQRQFGKIIDKFREAAKNIRRGYDSLHEYSQERTRVIRSYFISLEDIQRVNDGDLVNIIKSVSHRTNEISNASAINESNVAFRNDHPGAQSDSILALRNLKVRLTVLVNDYLESEYALVKFYRNHGLYDSYSGERGRLYTKHVGVLSHIADKILQIEGLFNREGSNGWAAIVSKHHLTKSHLQEVSDSNFIYIMRKARYYDSEINFGQLAHSRRIHSLKSKLEKYYVELSQYSFEVAEFSTELELMDPDDLVSYNKKSYLQFQARAKFWRTFEKLARISSSDTMSWLAYKMDVAGDWMTYVAQSIPELVDFPAYYDRARIQRVMADRQDLDAAMEDMVAALKRISELGLQYDNAYSADAARPQAGSSGPMENYRTLTELSDRIGRMFTTVEELRTRLLGRADILFESDQQGGLYLWRRIKDFLSVDVPPVWKVPFDPMSSGKTGDSAAGGLQAAQADRYFGEDEMRRAGLVPGAPRQQIRFAREQEIGGASGSARASNVMWDTDPALREIRLEEIGRMYRNQSMMNGEIIDYYHHHIQQIESSEPGDEQLSDIYIGMQRKYNLLSRRVEIELENFLSDYRGMPNFADLIEVGFETDKLMRRMSETVSMPISYEMEIDSASIVPRDALKNEKGVEGLYEESNVVTRRQLVRDAYSEIGRFKRVFRSAYEDMYRFANSLKQPRVDESAERSKEIVTQAERYDAVVFAMKEKHASFYRALDALSRVDSLVIEFISAPDSHLAQPAPWGLDVYARDILEEQSEIQLETRSPIEGRPDADHGGGLGTRLAEEEVPEDVVATIADELADTLVEFASDRSIAENLTQLITGNVAGELAPYYVARNERIYRSGVLWERIVSLLSAIWHGTPSSEPGKRWGIVGSILAKLMNEEIPSRYLRTALEAVGFEEAPLSWSGPRFAIEFGEYDERDYVLKAPPDTGDFQSGSVSGRVSARIGRVRDNYKHARQRYRDAVSRVEGSSHSGQERISMSREVRNAVWALAEARQELFSIDRNGAEWALGQRRGIQLPENAYITETFGARSGIAGIEPDVMTPGLRRFEKEKGIIMDDIFSSGAHPIRSRSDAAITRVVAGALEETPEPIEQTPGTSETRPVTGAAQDSHADFEPVAGSALEERVAALRQAGIVVGFRADGASGDPVLRAESVVEPTVDGIAAKLRTLAVAESGDALASGYRSSIVEESIGILMGRSTEDLNNFRSSALRSLLETGILDESMESENVKWVNGLAEDYIGASRMLGLAEEPQRVSPEYVSFTTDLYALVPSPAGGRFYAYSSPDSPESRWRFSPQFDSERVAIGDIFVSDHPIIVDNSPLGLGLAMAEASSNYSGSGSGRLVMYEIENVDHGQRAMIEGLLERPSLQTVALETRASEIPFGSARSLSGILSRSAPVDESVRVALYGGDLVSVNEQIIEYYYKIYSRNLETFPDAVFNHRQKVDLAFLQTDKSIFQAGSAFDVTGIRSHQVRFFANGSERNTPSMIELPANVTVVTLRPRRQVAKGSMIWRGRIGSAPEKIRVDSYVSEQETLGIPRSFDLDTCQ